MRGVVLAGGKGTRLGELTRVTNKHLLPVGPLPMVYYPIKKLVGAGVTEIMLVTGPEHAGDFISLLGSGSRLGCSLTYRVQEEAGGIAQALGLARNFCSKHHCAVVLGDNIFKESIRFVVEASWRARNCGWVVLKAVHDPNRYGVARFVDTEALVEIVEKPVDWVGGHAVTGIYLYPPTVFDVIEKLKPSARGELEITDVNNHFIRNGEMGYKVLKEYWTDAGTPESLSQANKYVTDQPPQY